MPPLEFKPVFTTHEGAVGLVSAGEGMLVRPGWGNLAGSAQGSG